MGFFEKLKNSIDSNEIKRKKSHLKNLYSVALADGRLDNREFDFLLSVSDKLYLDRTVVNNVVNFSDDIVFSIPSNDREKLDQIYDCVCMAVVDGEIDERELGTCKLIAVKMGFRPVVIDHLLNEILKSVIAGVTAEFILHKLKNEI